MLLVATTCLRGGPVRLGRLDIAVERRPRDVQRLADLLYGVGLVCVHGPDQSHLLGAREQPWSSPTAASSPCYVQPCQGPFPDQIALEFGQGAEEQELRDAALHQQILVLPPSRVDADLGGRAMLAGG